MGGGVRGEKSNHGVRIYPTAPLYLSMLIGTAKRLVRGLKRTGSRRPKPPEDARPRGDSRGFSEVGHFRSFKARMGAKVLLQFYGSS